MLRKKYDLNKLLYVDILIYSIVIFLFNLNSALDIILAIFVAVCFFKANIIELLSGYIFFSFFDDAIHFELLGGSLSRLLMVIIFLKLLYLIVKDKLKPGKKEIIIFSFIGFQIVFSMLIGTFSFGDIIIAVNILLFLMFSIVGKKEKELFENTLKKLLIYIVAGVFIAIIYGLLKFNFLYEETGTLQVYRFSGTYEPNFMGMYINMAIIIILFSERLNKYIKALALVVLVGTLGMTLSVTGVIVACIIFFMYIMKKGEFLKRTGYILGIGISSLLLFGMSQYVFNVINTMRLNNSIQVEEGTEEVVEETTSEETVSMEEQQENTDTDINSTQQQTEEVEKDTQEITVDVIEDNTAIKRGKSLIKNFKEGDFDTLTSGRLPIYKSFLKASFSRNMKEVMFGNGLSDEQLYCDFFGREKEAHNSYLNCLYNFGIIGFILIVIGIVIVMKRNSFFNMNLQNTKYEKTVSMLRIMFLIYAVVLSLYTKKMVLVFFLI